MIEIAVGLALAAIFLSGVTAIFSILAYCKVVGFENSTHQIQYMPAPQPKPYEPEGEEEPFGPTGEELVKRFNPDYEEEDDYDLHQHP